MKQKQSRIIIIVEIYNALRRHIFHAWNDFLVRFIEEAIKEYPDPPVFWVHPRMDFCFFGQSKRAPYVCIMVAWGYKNCIFYSLYLKHNFLFLNLKMRDLWPWNKAIHWHPIFHLIFRFFFNKCRRVSTTIPKKFTNIMESFKLLKKIEVIENKFISITKYVQKHQVFYCMYKS